VSVSAVMMLMLCVQLRDLRSEMEELQNNRVEVDSITRAEIKAKELENTLRAEERSARASSV